MRSRTQDWQFQLRRQVSAVLLAYALVLQLVAPALARADVVGYGVTCSQRTQGDSRVLLHDCMACCLAPTPAIAGAPPQIGAPVGLEVERISLPLRLAAAFRAVPGLLPPPRGPPADA